MRRGYGSINHMIVTLRNNKLLLPEKRSFFKPKNYQTTKAEYYKAVDDNFNFKKASAEQLRKVRATVIHKRKREARKFVIVACLALPLIFFGIYQVVDSFRFGTPTLEEKIAKANIEKKNEEQYMFFIEDGDTWLYKRNYYNAVFQYKKALELFPNDFEANYRLALAYSYRCQYNFEDCKNGMQLTKKLAKQFPNNQEIRKIKAVFVNWGE